MSTLCSSTAAWMKLSQTDAVAAKHKNGGLRRSHCGRSVSSGSRGMNLQSGVRGGPCRQPRSCCLEVTSSPPFWLQVSPPGQKQRKDGRYITHAVNLEVLSAFSNHKHNFGTVLLWAGFRFVVSWPTPALEPSNLHLAIGFMPIYWSIDAGGSAPTYNKPAVSEEEPFKTFLAMTKEADAFTMRFGEKHRFKNWIAFFLRF